MFFQTLTENIACGAAALSSLVCLGFRSLFAQSRKVRTIAENATRRFFPRPNRKFEAVLEACNGTPALKVRGLNIHRCGALVVAKRPLTPGTVVHFRIPALGLMGYGHVRHCDVVAVAGKYRVGLEFRAELLRSVPGTWEVSRVVDKPATEADNMWA